MFTRFNSRTMGHTSTQKEQETSMIGRMTRTSRLTRALPVGFHSQRREMPRTRRSKTPRWPRSRHPRARRQSSSTCTSKTQRTPSSRCPSRAPSTSTLAHPTTDMKTNMKSMGRMDRHLHQGRAGREAQGRRPSRGRQRWHSTHS